jgi:hypothetical protein
MNKLLLVIIFLVIYSDAKMLRDSSIVDEEVVFDSTSLLMWQDDNDVQVDLLTWSEAISYCESSTKASYSNWRLPNINELNTIIDDSKANPSMSEVFGKPLSARYWSSTTAEQNKAYAWHFDFSDSSEDYTSKTSTLNIRCVREIQ